MAASRPVMERAHRLVREAEFLDREYQAFLKEGTKRLEESMLVKMEARELLERDGATVAQMKAVFDES